MRVRQRLMMALLLSGSLQVFAQPGESPLHRIARVAAAAHLPVGIVLGSDRSLCDPVSRANTADGLGGEAGLLALAEQYRLTAESERPLVLESNQLGRGRLKEALTHPYATLPAFHGTMSFIGATLDGWLGAYLHPGEGYAMSWASATDAEQLSTPAMTDASLEEAANAAIISGSKGLWIAEEHVSLAGVLSISMRIFSYHDDRYGLEHLECSAAPQ